jgi:hypothetical protein
LFSDGGPPWLWSGLLPVALVMAVITTGTLSVFWSQGGRPRSSASRSERRAWVVLAVLLLIGGTVVPDSLGGHGSILSQRFTMLGIAVLVPALDFDWITRPKRGVPAMLTAAVVLQSAVIWDYATYCNGIVGTLMQVRPALGQGKRVGTLFIQVRRPFRANPLQHADTILGIGTGNIVWNNYEVSHYYFPVHFQPEISIPPFELMEPFDLNDDHSRDESRLRRWDGLLSCYHSEIDEIVIWGSDPGFDAITDRWYETVFRAGDARLVHRRERLPSR